LAISSLLFGLCHWISTAYVVMATAMGLLLGGLFLATGNLAAPMVAHALYDFLALLYLTRHAEVPSRGGGETDVGRPASGLPEEGES